MLSRACLSSVVLLLTTTLLPGDVSASSAFGADEIVGSFRLHVQIQQRRVEVMERKGNHAPASPATELIAQFVDWDPSTREFSIAVAVGNTAASTLFAPLELVATKLAPPTVIPVNPDGGTSVGSFTWIYGADQLSGGTILSPTQQSEAKEWVFRSPTAMDFQVDIAVLAGVPLPAGQGATIESPDGATVTVQPNSIPYEALVDIELVPEDAVEAPLGDLAFGGAAKLTFRPADFNAVLPPPTEPFEIAIPASVSSPGSQFVVAQQLLVDDIAAPTPGLGNRLVPVDTAVLSADYIVTDGDIFGGIFAGGMFVFLGTEGSATGLQAGGDSGFVGGVVSDSNGARPGAVVSNTTNTLVAVTDGAGRYTLLVSSSSFTVTAFDPFRGSGGSASGTLPAPDTSVTANISLVSLASPPITRDGVRNGGFERGAVTSWSTTGAAGARQQLVCSGETISPTEAAWMGDFHTGPGSVGGIGSSMKQRFRVPAGVETLRLDFNFVSEEFPEFVGSIFDDAFKALITTPYGQTTFADVSVNNSGGFTLIGDCFFPGGDGTAGMTGWRTASVDLSAYAGTNTPIEVELLFTAIDAGDAIYDTHVLVDNIRFSTVWVDANAIQAATADRMRVEAEVRSANEILSQAGVNVRLRDFQTVADPGGLVDTDLASDYTCTLLFFNCGFERTAEEQQLLSLSRSATPTDVNVYYVRSVTGASSCARAYGPDDYRDGAFSRLDLLTEGGTIHRNVGNGCAAGGHILAHELGHLLISPQKAGNVLEHDAGVTNFMGGTGSSPLLGIVNRQQSTNINRSGAPLLVP